MALSPGDRLGVYEGGSALNVAELDVVLNWFEELKARVPVP